VVAGAPQPEATTPADPELVPFATPRTSPTAELDGRIEIMLSSGAKCVFAPARARCGGDGEFLVIKAINDFLIDRVFQRISDVLVRWCRVMASLRFCSLVEFC
jgi:hypothetical protein